MVPRLEFYGCVAVCTKAVILAGGLGTRLRPFTQVIPKPLLPVGEKAVLEIQIDRLRRCGVTDVWLATNYRSEYIESFFGDGSRYGVRLRVSREAEPLGTAGPLTLLRDALTEPFIVMNGDILSLVDFGKMAAFARQAGAVLTVAVKREIMPFAFGNIFFDGDFVTGIEEKPDVVMHILAGIYVMTPRIFEFIPRDRYYGMDHLIIDLLQQGVPIAKYDLQEYWLDIGRTGDYEEAQQSYHKHFGNDDAHE